MPGANVQISLLVPTRGRPHLVRRLLESLVEQTDQLDAIEVIFYVDSDDLESQDIGHDRIRTTRIVGPDASMGAYNTRCLQAASGAIVVLLNDDVVVRTRGWDRRLVELDRRFADRVYLGYGNDWFKRGRVSTFPILSRATCDLLGEPFPAAYCGSLIDYHVFDTFRRLERLGHRRIVFLSDVVFEHAHYRLGKGVYDETYRRRRRFGDDLTFMALRGGRQRSAERLAASVEGRAPAGPMGAPGAAPDPVTDSVAGYWTAFAIDRGLPWRWRGFLFAWYVGRHVARRLGWGQRPDAAGAAPRSGDVV
jgi:glycosyltransferase involved in cell wall biosynthesis